MFFALVLACTTIPRMRFSLLVIVALSFFLGCGTADIKTTNTAANTPQTTGNPPSPKDGDYAGKGTVTKIDLVSGSVEMDHEAVAGLMPAMIMEFFVSDKALLNGLALGDKVDFTILYKGGTETITKIGKTK